MWSQGQEPFSKITCFGPSVYRAVEVSLPCTNKPKNWTIQGEEENSCGRDGGHEGHQQTAISGKDSPTQGGGRIRNIQETQSDRGRATLSQYVRRPTGRSVPEKFSVSKNLERKNGVRGDV